MKKEIAIDNSIVTNLQQLSIEVDSRKELLAFMIDKGMNSNNDRFKAYEDEYKEYFFSYETAKKILQRDVLEPAFGKENLIRWDLNFDSCICTVEVRDN